MVWGGKSPLPSQTKSDLFVSDSFRERSLLSAWEWRYQPQPGAWSFTGNGLRLKAYIPLARRVGFAGVRNVLTQRSARSAKAQVTVQLNLSGMADKQEAGLAHFAKTDCRIAIVQAGKLRRVERFDQADAMPGPSFAGETVWLRSTWTAEGIAHFSYSFDGSTYTEMGNPCRLSWGAYRGDRVGLYTMNNDTDRGYVDFIDFRYEIH
jgi:beta-xylosidase